ncbi:MAG: ABC transporter substrate-binding protein [Dehalococcoidia bacterium]|nr:ABC transporter substrate-binding protein [Dehalococcoidia bacterium]
MTAIPKLLTNLAAAAALMILMAVGCTAAAPTPTPTPPTPIPPTTTPLPAPPPPPVISETRIITIASSADPPHFDVQQTFSPALHRSGPGLVYSRLLRFRSEAADHTFALGIECDLCVSWRQVDPVTYRFQLRQGVHWPDLSPVNGRELTADDIIYSYQRQATPGWENSTLLRNLQGFNKLDPYTLEIKTQSPDADFLVALADGHSKIVAREVVQAYGDLRTAPPIGTGPWQWQSGAKGVEYVLARNPHYYEEGVPASDRLQVHVIPGLDNRFAALAVGTLDLADVPSSRASTLKEGYPGMGLLKVDHYGQGTELTINTRVAPLQDVMVRQALFLALNPWSYLKSAQGEAFSGMGMPLESKEWLLPEGELRSYWGAPDKALALLRQAGVQPAITLMVADYGDASLALAERVAQDLQAVNISVERRIVNPMDYADQVWSKGQFSVALGPLAPLTTPNDYFLGVLHSKGSANFTGYRDAELDRLLEAQATAADPVSRQALIREIQRRALDGAVRFMVATQTSYWAWQPRVTGFHPNLAGYEYFYYARISVPES